MNTIEAGAVTRQPRAQRFSASEEARDTTSIKDVEFTVHGPGFAFPLALLALWRRMKERRSDRRRHFAVGVDGVRSEVFERSLGRSINEISRKLLERDADGRTAYTFAPLARKLVTGKEGKPRTVLVPRLRDQVVLRAITEEIQAAMRLRGISSAPPSLRSCRSAIQRAISRRGLTYVLRSDVASYYDSIPHGPLLERVRELELDPDILVLVERLLEAPQREPYADRASDERRVVGVPAGVSLSSVLGELYLAPLERELRASGVFCLRYVDDILVLASTAAEISRAREVLESGLSRLGLRSSAEKTWQGPVSSDAVFLGIRLDPEGVRLDPPRVTQWLMGRRRVIATAARRIALERDQERRLARLEELVLYLNRDISGISGRMIPAAAGAADLSALEILDRGLRRALGGIFRRCEARPTGRFQLASALEWGQRWKRSPRRALEVALGLYGQRPRTGTGLSEGEALDDPRMAGFRAPPCGELGWQRSPGSLNAMPEGGSR